MSKFHTLTPAPFHSASFGERLGLEMISAVLWPLGEDERMTVLLSMLGTQIINIADNEDQIDALIEALRARLKLSLSDGDRQSPR
ncbi:hypothetical protein JQ633_29645 [Bradyrhizobium tropiciagri]|uniref:hypothetical protein n=1 Tax=Bradyrhizobium tropiciagri TaxID=312253 RepID=UPI001BA66C88|nr:hypothetical protein [Bradyrhizobium tropiciagri]MBR0874554.1 hypothetical protein [Bradyrhizobium tropiciagri]